MGLRSSLVRLIADADRLRADFSGRSARPAADMPRSSGMLRPSPPAAVATRAFGPVALTRAVIVEEVVRETPDAVSLVLRDESGAPFVFAAGQFLTVVVVVDGEPHRRCYSISSSADVTETATITVKRVIGGKVSRHIVENVRAGMRLDVAGPAGGFTPSPARPRRRLVLIAGGSGITPMMSIARTVLARETSARVDLVYGNRTVEDTIFQSELAALETAHTGRFRVRHVVGTILGRTVAAAELEALGDPAAVEGEAEYLLCGPAPMMQEVRAALTARGVSAEAVREERFSLGLAPPLTASPQAHDRPATVQLRVRRHGEPLPVFDLPISTELPILKAALAAGVELPYSCTEGVCGACRVRAADPGAVDMDPLHCLSSTELQSGYVLTCVSRARRDLDLEVE